MLNNTNILFVFDLFLLTDVFAVDGDPIQSYW